MKTIYLILLSLFLISCQAQTKKTLVSETKKEVAASIEKNIKKDTMQFEITKPEETWKKELSEMEYHVLREKGTERPYTGEYDNHFENGHYVCAACENPLFTSTTKFKSHCGWPSFDAAIKGSVIYEKDTSFGMERIEVMCAKCGGHLGHVFDDGPEETTGMRYCTNSVSIKFVAE